MQCKRIVTVRELARSQGFPDKFVFHAENDRVMTVCAKTHPSSLHTNQIT
jgi:site-specific DNA-cytosine methylase